MCTKMTSPVDFRDAIRASLDGAAEHRRRTGRPFCTLTYAQSVDGCITFRPMTPMPLSGRESMEFTHHLRSWHDAILVGVRTVMSDNPRLNVRLVSGPNPQPIVLDSHLRMPPECRLLTNGVRRPWIAAGLEAETERQRELESLGARVFRFPHNGKGWVVLESLLDVMASLDVNSIMVEGGARVLTSFMKSRLVDQLIVTISPVVVGGIHAFSGLGRVAARLPKLQNMRYAQLGQDIVLWAKPVWEG